MKVYKGYDFDDLLLVPRPSKVKSRENVWLGVHLDELKDKRLTIPFIASPMKGIISPELIIEMDKLGGIGIMHRFSDNRKELMQTLVNISMLCNNWGVAIGLDNVNELDVLKLNPTIVCIDIANGNLESLKDWVKIVKDVIKKLPCDTLIMTGNVTTYDSAKILADAGADLIRVGIGNGNLCTTRNITGVGVPQLTALDNCKDVDAIIVCDGGIRNSGDAVKALAMGADVIMMGTPFARTYESANNGIIYGQASRKLQEEYYHSVKSVEGVEKEVNKDISLKDLMSEFTWGMKSAFTYLNARNIKELQKNALWVETGTGSIKKL